MLEITCERYTTDYMSFSAGLYKITIFRFRGLIINFSLEGSTLQLLTSSLSDRHIDFIIFDVMTVNETSELRDMLEEVFGELDVRNVIVMSQLVFAEQLFRQVTVKSAKGESNGISR